MDANKQVKAPGVAMFALVTRGAKGGKSVQVK